MGIEMRSFTQHFPFRLFCHRPGNEVLLDKLYEESSMPESMKSLVSSKERDK